ncbi:MAG: hypothetical protein WDN75_08855 [Bacteroidota bacterium]
MKELDRLFADAKAKNELEFVRALINYRGPSSRFLGSNLFEWFEAIENYERWYRRENYSLHEKGRFALLLYSTFFEATDLYLILGNLSRVATGHRVIPHGYWKHEKQNHWLGVNEKISLIEELLIDAGFETVQRFFRDNHFEQIRNAFFHSTYAFDNDDYILNDVETLYIDYLGHHTLSLTEFLFPKVEIILEFFHRFKDLLIGNMKAYSKGTQGTEDGGEIFGSESGIVGYKDNEGNTLSLSNDCWMDATGHLQLRALVDRHVMDELDRLEKKAKLTTDDGCVHHLYDALVQRKNQTERQRLGGIYARLGDMLLSMSSSEPNHFRMFKLRDLTRKYYERMSELSPAHQLHPKYSLLKYIAAPHSAEGFKVMKEAANELIQVLKGKVTEEALINVSRMLPRLKANGIDIESEKKSFAKILETKVPPELKDKADEIANELGKL